MIYAILSVGPSADFTVSRITFAEHETRAYPTLVDEAYGSALMTAQAAQTDGRKYCVVMFENELALELFLKPFATTAAQDALEKKV